MLMIIIGGTWMVFPKEGWLPAGYTPPGSNADAPSTDNGGVHFDSGQMLKTPQYYMIFLTFAFGASAGLMTIGLMKLFPMQALQAAGIDKAIASGIAGTAMAVFFSLANGFGRIA